VNLTIRAQTKNPPHGCCNFGDGERSLGGGGGGGGRGGFVATPRSIEKIMALAGPDTRRRGVDVGGRCDINLNVEVVSAHLGSAYKVEQKEEPKK